MKYYENIKFILNLKNIRDLKINNNFIEIVNDELSEVIKTYNIKELHNRLNNIFNFIKYEVHDEISWVKRLDIIVNELKQDSSSLYSMRIRYGKKNGKIFFDEKNNRCSQTKEKYIIKYGDIDGRIKWKDKFINCGHSLDKYKKRYGNDIGIVLYNESMLKKKKTINERKLNGKKYKNGRTLNEYISRDGEIIGTEKYNNRNKIQSNRFSIEYYLNKFGENEGIDKWEEYKKKMDKTSLDALIKKYGNDEGKEKHEKYLIKKIYYNSLEYYIKKYGDDGELKWNEYRNKTIFKIQRYSKISQELFWSIYNRLNDNQKKNCMFAECNKERFIRKGNEIIFIDFTLKNIAIEFDGTYWHSSESTKNKDLRKTKLINEFGFLLLRIPENNYIKNKNLVLENCMKYINNNYNE